ncbi:MAG: hypothetical protein ACI91R_000217, partial [Vicingaceae bacterium]
TLAAPEAGPADLSQIAGQRWVLFLKVTNDEAATENAPLHLKINTASASPSPSRKIVLPNEPAESM